MTATDTANAMISGSNPGFIQVVGAAASLQATVQEGPFYYDQPFTVTLTAFDAFGNVAVGYSGTVSVNKSTYSPTDSVPDVESFDWLNGVAEVAYVFGSDGYLTFTDLANGLTVSTNNITLEYVV